MGSVRIAPLSSVSPPSEKAEVPSTGRAETVASNAATFADFYDEHFSFVWRSAEHLLGFNSIVDDVVQEVFLVAMRRLPEFEGRSSLRSWLYGILRRVVSDHRRSIRRRNMRDSADLDAIATRATGPDFTAERAQARIILYQLLEQLDDNKREVFVLAELEQMTAPQIAEAIGVNTTTVHARLRDARKELSLLAERYRPPKELRGA